MAKIYEVISTKRETTMDCPLQIGVVVYHLANICMLKVFNDFIDQYVDRRDFELLEINTDSNYLAYSEESIDKLIKPELRDEYENNKTTSYLESKMNYTQHFK